MNCNTCRYELSQCLDGRLPSGRRAVVMQHVDRCEVCASFWAELQAAQQLTLQLPKERVSEGFRDQLWERIRAGEGTPDAVFHEPVPAFTKVRYLLTGAAAAAAVLVLGSWLRSDGKTSDTDRPETNLIAEAPLDGNAARGAAERNNPNALRPRDPASNFPSNGRQRLVQSGFVQSGNDPRDQTPAMFASAQRLTPDLVAVEAARQFEQRFDSANRHLLLLDGAAAPARDAVVGRLFEETEDLHTFAEVLLELRDDDRVSFHDAEVGADLRLTANLLRQGQLQQRSLDTVRQFVAPALRQSRRLASIAQQIRVRPSLDPREEQEVLVRLNTQRPDVFTQLFYVVSRSDACESFGMLPKGDVFQFVDQCGAMLVSPRRLVEEGNQRFELRIESTGNGELHVHVTGEKRE